MKKLIAIVAGEPNSINSEIIVKTWKIKKNKKKFFVIGNYLLIKNQINKIGLKIPLMEISSIDQLSNNKLNILNVTCKFKSVFKNKITNTKNYVLECLDIAHNLAVNDKIKGFINAPINKAIFDGKYLGVTEYLAAKNNVKDKEVMLIYNNKLSVVPLTTHLEIKNITSKINFKLLKAKILTLNNSYSRLFKNKPKIAVLGLNPHNSEHRNNSIENKVIKPAIKKLRFAGLKINGPFPADTIFSNQKKFDFNVIVGMYHDQVLAPFKAIYGYDAINITLGLKYIRVSPDHGIAQDIVGLNKANPQSLISAVNFFDKVND